jgi:hypothetical protein
MPSQLINKEQTSYKGICDDAMIAIEFIIKYLEENEIQDLADILKDTLHAHTNIKKQISTTDQYSINEYSDLLYLYFINKYYNKITLDNYKQKVVDLVNNQNTKHENNTVR